MLLTNPNGGTVQVSLNDPNPLHQFADVNPGFPQIFEPFSGDQLFAAIGGNQVQVDFVIPLTFTPALTRGFGVVFSDVDVFGPTTIQLFDANNNPIGLAEKVPASVPPGGPENESFSFLGLLFDNPVIRRAVITNGNFEISSGFSDGKDLVVMDDYLFSTPAVPEPSTWLLVIAGLGGLGGYAELVWCKRGVGRPQRPLTEQAPDAHPASGACFCDCENRVRPEIRTP